jgi:hypothetical protein
LHMLVYQTFEFVLHPKTEREEVEDSRVGLTCDKLVGVVLRWVGVTWRRKPPRTSRA